MVNEGSRSMTARWQAACRVLGIAALLATTAQARAWHGHHRYRYLTIRSDRASIPPGYHCPLGEYWRPSLRLCQGGPYSGGVQAGPRPVAALPSEPSVPPRPVTEGPSIPSNGHVVSTDTRVVDRRRDVGRGGVTVTYTVRTRVTERYPREPAAR